MLVEGRPTHTEAAAGEVAQARGAEAVVGAEVAPSERQGAELEPGQVFETAQAPDLAVELAEAVSAAFMDSCVRDGRARRARLLVLDHAPILLVFTVHVKLK
jgi:hypothetical protein